VPRRSRGGHAVAQTWDRDCQHHHDRQPHRQHDRDATITLLSIYGHGLEEQDREIAGKAEEAWEKED
jgi:hypothetical protein